jgi:amyloid beta precursor protein binding protein 1
MRALELFQEEAGHAPSTREEKDRFKAIISKMSRNPQEQNFAEALSNAYKAWTPYTIPDAAKDVLELRTSNSRNEFWIVAKAVAHFARDCGKLPLAGSLPDMTASTEWYTKLQEIYASRASGDCAAIVARCALDPDATGLSPEYVTRFCKNALNVEVFRFRSLKDELQNPVSPEEGGLDLACESEDEDSLIHWYLALRAADQFREKYRHWPGFQCSESACAGEAALLAEEAKQVVECYKAEITCDPKTLEEVVRYGGCELHVTSSVLGGIASQEAVKLITKQYAPLNNTLIYDGLHGKMQTLEV